MEDPEGMTFLAFHEVVYGMVQEQLAKLNDGDVGAARISIRSIGFWSRRHCWPKQSW